MKQIALGISSIVLTTLIILGLFSLETRMARENELDNAINLASKSALDRAINSRQGTVVSNEELIEEFKENLLFAINKGKTKNNDENLKLDINIAQADVDKGILAVEVQEEFLYPNGKKGTVNREKVVVLEQLKDGLCQIKFMVHDMKEGDICIKEYEIAPGGKLILPQDYKDYLWQNEDGTAQTSFPEIVEKNMTFWGLSKKKEAYKSDFSILNICKFAQNITVDTVDVNNENRFKSNELGKDCFRKIELDEEKSDRNILSESKELSYIEEIGIKNETAAVTDGPIKGRYAGKTSRMRGQFRSGESTENESKDLLDHNFAWSVATGETLILDDALFSGSTAKNFNNGFLVREGTTLVVTNHSTFGDIAGVWIYLQGGTLILEEGFSAPNNYCFCMGGGTIIINGGRWQSSRFMGGNGVFCLNKDSNVTVNGGYIGSYSMPDTKRCVDSVACVDAGITSEGDSIVTVTMNGGEIKGCGYGIKARDFSMTGGKIYDCNQAFFMKRSNAWDRYSKLNYGQGVIIQNGQGLITGGEIINNRINVLNNGTTTFEGGTIQGADLYGVLSYGTFNQKEEIGGNGQYGVVINSGKYNNYGCMVAHSTQEMIENRNYDAASIYLGSNTFINLCNEVSSELGSVYSDGNPLGRKILVVDCNPSGSGLSKEKYAGKIIKDKKLTLSSINNQCYISYDVVGLDNKNVKRFGVLRPGTGSGNGAKGEIVLSVPVQMQYKSLLKEDFDRYGFAVSLPAGKQGFWMESMGNAEEPIVYYGGKSLGSSIKLMKWDIMANGAKKIPVSVGEPIPIESTNLDRKATDIWLVDGDEPLNENRIYYYKCKVNLLLDGNGQNDGDNKCLKGFTDEMTLPENWFLKEDLTNKWSFIGWSFDKNGTYKDTFTFENDQFLAGNDGKSLLDAVLKKAKEQRLELEYSEVDSCFLPKLTMYAIWDKFPELSSFDMFIKPDEIDFLSTEQIVGLISAKDLEDGDMAKSIKFIEDLEKVKLELDEIVKCGPVGSTSISYQVVDGAKNKSFAEGRIHVVDANPADRAYYIRFVDEDNYKKTSHLLGGMEEKSVWLNSPDYVEVINKAFMNLNNNSFLEQYSYSW